MTPEYHTEIIFCDDQSTDGTAAEVRRMRERHPHRDIKLVEGPGIGKADQRVDRGRQDGTPLLPKLLHDNRLEHANVVTERKGQAFQLVHPAVAERWQQLTIAEPPAEQVAKRCVLMDPPDSQ